MTYKDISIDTDHSQRNNTAYKSDHTNITHDSTHSG